MWVYYARKPKRYMERYMPTGCIYGRDNISPFMCELYRTTEKESLLATLKIERLDMMNGGWYVSYESNSTTVEIMKEVFRHGMRTIYTSRYANGNPRAKVRNASSTRVTANTYATKYDKPKLSISPLKSYVDMKVATMWA